MTELTWDGKYDADGNKVAPLRVSLPFQAVETVNESAQERQRMLDLFSAGRDSDWRNRLIWGDKKYVLPSLLDEFAGKVNLVYIDPPFNVGADFSFTTTIPAPEDDEDEDRRGLEDRVGLAFTKEPSIIEKKAYRDTWGRGMDSYLQWFYETSVFLRELLSDEGSIYVHLDYHVSHYAKAILDEVFGNDNFVSEIIWKRTSAHGSADRYGPIHDTIFFYSKGKERVWNKPLGEYNEEYIEQFYRQVDERGRRYQLIDCSAPGDRKGTRAHYDWKGRFPPPGRHWAVVKEEMERLEVQGLIVYSSTGTPRRKQFLDEMLGQPVQDIWTDIKIISSQSNERVDYATQKPEALLERIIKASSNEGDLVLDCFCGSGTTAATAEKLNRRWITCDLGRFAIHTTRKRLLSIPGVRPFVVQNLGKYERQVWQRTEFQTSNAKSQNPKTPTSDQQSAIENQQWRAQRAYVEFVLRLYGARPIAGYTWLHGLKSGRMVHVGAVDAPVALGDVKQIVAEFKKSIGKGKDAPTQKGVDALGWDFAFELHEVAKQQAAEAGINLRFFRIPTDVMDKRAVDQGDIHFFELAALSVDVTVGANPRVRPGQTRKSAPTANAPTEVTLALTDFVIPPDDVPEDVQRAVTHWSQWIDYWAVDWDYKGDTFHNQWQTYRTRQSRELERSTAHTYEEAGKYTVMVKVIDILGNDTTKTLAVEVKG